MRVPRLDPRQIQHRRHDIEHLHRLGNHVPLCAAGHPDHQRHPRQRVVQPAGPLFHQAIVARPVAMVRRNDQRGVLGQAGLLQRPKQLAQHPVHIAVHPQIHGADALEYFGVHLSQLAVAPDQLVEIGLFRQVGRS